MSLDQNLFTLNVIPDPSTPSATDLVDPVGTAHYRKVRVGGPLYRMDLLDPLSGALLARATAPDATSKTKVIELFNPSLVVEFRSVGTLSFKWTFHWEDHEFEWKREECYMVRKPDPAVLVAVTKEPPGRLRSTAVQILDYNLHRFDIADRKGFEIALLSALLTLHDLSDSQNGPPPAYAEPEPEPVQAQAPAVPPKLEGLDRIAEAQAARGEVNEVTVTEDGTVEDYAAYSARLLEDDAMLFISIRAESAPNVPRVLAVVEEAKRLRYKQGIEEELHQYVVYDAKPARRGRINLDDPAPTSARAYTPPDALTVHLSKIDMPELKPKTTPPKASHFSRASCLPFPPRFSYISALSALPTVHSTLSPARVISSP
ncbi:hypothetical protein K488DRAFT_54773 [Vararia minispora EC-137]|uniref:Uncharacterized protein n=1 Tax=Vararia minispora EC-137 TaxID=1314806 RepID=A0ACB8QEB8_9AGAM|nr:hypothetical protein K488DRAFT_54773 [Vararia minispora EC-137]